MKVFLVVLALVCLLSCTLYAQDVPLVKTGPRELEFGNLHWRMKSSLTPTAPGPNYFRGTEDAVWVDDWGLHLTIQEQQGTWWATEIFTRERVGYGTYTFTVETDIQQYDPNVVAGFFTWDTAPQEYNREIDIEFAAWGQPSGTLFQYVVQPYADPSRIFVFKPALNGNVTTHRIVWTADGVTFSSYHGSVDPDQMESSTMLIKQWHHRPSPTEGKVRFRINFWLYQGTIPVRPAHMVITSFSFVPHRP